MNIDDLLLNIKAVTFDDLVCQTEVTTKEDVANLRSKGYYAALTLDDFVSRFDIEPKYVWYSPSISSSSLYYNPETLAVCPLRLELLVLGDISFTVENLYKQIIRQEELVKKHDYTLAIYSLPDAMRLEYFKLLVNKKGSNIPNLYELFIDFYQMSDYGFGLLDKETISTIFLTKSDEDIAKTNKQLEHLPSVITVYRGCNSLSTQWDKAYSWTLDKNVANFFATKNGTDNSYIATATIKKEDVIECLCEDNSEKEIILFPDKLTLQKIENLKGLDFISNLSPNLIEMYHDYRDSMDYIDFAQNSSIHGKTHQSRVLLLCLIIAQMLNLSLEDKDRLSTAAIYHDSQRLHDGEDIRHGKDARIYYTKDYENPDPIVEFLCEYHCLPDEEGLKELENNEILNKDLNKHNLLFNIFKDADALDRVRFGIRSLDINQLRLNEAKELTLVARILYQNIKVD